MAKPNKPAVAATATSAPELPVHTYFNLHVFSYDTYGSPGFQLACQAVSNIHHKTTKLLKVKDHTSVGKFEYRTHFTDPAHIFKRWNFSSKNIKLAVEQVCYNYGVVLPDWCTLRDHYRNLEKTRYYSTEEFIRSWIDIIVPVEAARIYKGVYDKLGGIKNKDADKKALKAVEEFNRECK